MAGTVFSIVVVTLLVSGLLYQFVRQRRNRDLNAWVQDQAVLFECPVLVRQCLHPGANWVDWNSKLGGGPRLLIRRGAIEVKAPQGMMLQTRDVCLVAATTSMWHDEIGWAGTALGQRECIHLLGKDETSEVELALTAIENLGATWAALVQSGVQVAGAGAALDQKQSGSRRIRPWTVIPIIVFIVAGLIWFLTPSTGSEGFVLFGMFIGAVCCGLVAQSPP